MEKTRPHQALVHHQVVVAGKRRTRTLWRRAKCRFKHWRGCPHSAYYHR